MRVKRAVGMLSAAALGAAVLVAGPAPSAVAVEMVPFAISIRHANCIDPCSAEGLEAPLQGRPDFYVKVWINGVKLPLPSDDDSPSSPIIDNDDIIDPIWTIPAMIPADLMDVPVAIQLWDDDGSSGDDLADISPAVDDNNLDFVVNRRNNTWFGAEDGIVSPRSCSFGGGGGDNDGPRANLCFDLGGDRDGDGLLDQWEQFGYDDNDDGVIDVDLPAMGADPDHKDLFLEIDWDSVNGPVPTALAIDSMRAAFAQAPIDAGSLAGQREADGDQNNNDETFGVSAPPNPDGLPGITLHVDTGNLIDTSASESPPVRTCFDGVDNGPDGTADGADPDCVILDASVEDPAGPSTCTQFGPDNDGDGLDDRHDPDCLVGDVPFANGLGHGQPIANPTACGVDANFYAAKNSPPGLRPIRRYLFRYAISSPLAAGCTDRGGQAEIGGNDVASFNGGTAIGPTLMHELGHTLNLHHGGFEDDNCKPNYVSIMNYDMSGGVPRVDGGAILDYSPPRILVNEPRRGTAPLADLQEDELDENVVVDGTDPMNRFVFVNGNGDKVTARLNEKPNWNGDADLGPGESFEDDVEVNVDTFGADGEPVKCENDDSDDLTGAADWPYVSLSFHGFGEAADGPVRPEQEPFPTTAQMATLDRELNRTDLTATQTDSPDPVAAGTDLTYTVTVANQGPNAATSVQVVDTLPTGLVFKASSLACPTSGQTVTCNLATMDPGASRSFTIVSSVPADLVYNNGGPKSVTNKVEVSNLAGPDSAAANNVATETTQVVAVADVSVTSSSTTSPLEALIGQPVNASVTVGITNSGPSSPIDTILTTTATASPGVTVTPASSTSAQNALAAGSPRSIAASVSLSCTSPGLKSVSLSSSLALKNAADTDPDLTNNTRTSSFTIDCVVPIAINVRPGGSPNSINLNTDATLAALTTRAGEYGLPLDVDATKIVATTAQWGQRAGLFNVAFPRGAPEIHAKVHPTRSYELDEKTRDADLDVEMHFKPVLSGLTLTSTQACLKGKYLAPDGNRYTFLGCDSVRVVN